MAAILKRTMFIGRGNDGLIRFPSWYKVVTPLGVMWEPGNRMIRAQAGQERIDDRDATDEMSRIDDIEFVDPSGFSLGENTCKGDTMPVEGY